MVQEVPYLFEEEEDVRAMLVDLPRDRDQQVAFLVGMGFNLKEAPPPVPEDTIPASDSVLERLCREHPDVGRATVEKLVEISMGMDYTELAIIVREHNPVGRHRGAVPAPSPERRQPSPPPRVNPPSPRPPPQAPKEMRREYIEANKADEDLTPIPLQILNLTTAEGEPLFRKVAVFLGWHAHRISGPAKGYAQLWWNTQAMTRIAPSSGRLLPGWDRPLAPVPAPLEKYLKEIRGDEMPIYSFTVPYCSKCDMPAVGVGAQRVCPQCGESCS